MLILTDDLVNSLVDVVDVAPGDAGNRLDLIPQRSEGVFLSEFKKNIDLVLHGVALVWLTEDVELVGS